MGPIDQLSDDQKEIWHTYLYQARRQTRQSAKKAKPPIQVKPAIADRSLLCYRERRPSSYYDSLASIVFSVFVAESRIDLVGTDSRIGVSKARRTDYLDRNGTRITKRRGGVPTFHDLSLWEQWRNLPLASGRRETKRYLASVGRLGRWITMRNDIAHADYKRLAQLAITPQDALDCYEAVVDAIFELNILLYDDRNGNEKNKSEVSLIPDAVTGRSTCCIRRRADMPCVTLR